MMNEVILDNQIRDFLYKLNEEQNPDLDTIMKLFGKYPNLEKIFNGETCSEYEESVMEDFIDELNKYVSI